MAKRFIRGLSSGLTLPPLRVVLTVLAFALYSCLGGVAAATEAVPDSSTTLPPDSQMGSDKAFTLLFPESAPVGGEDLIEFRARSAGITHAFIALGRRQADGSTYFYAAAGFYPKDGKATSFSTILSAPGKVTYTVDDIGTDVTYRARISPAQVRVVKHILKSWEAASYSVPASYCVDLAKSVANYLGLSYDTGVGGLLPLSFTASLRTLNSETRPLVHEATVDAVGAKNVNRVRARETADAAQRLREQEGLPSARPKDGSSMPGGFSATDSVHSGGGAADSARSAGRRGARDAGSPGMTLSTELKVKVPDAASAPARKP